MSRAKQQMQSQVINARIVVFQRELAKEFNMTEEQIDQIYGQRVYKKTLDIFDHMSDKYEDEIDFERRNPGRRRGGESRAVQRLYGLSGMLSTVRKAFQDRCGYVSTVVQDVLINKVGVKALMMSYLINLLRKTAAEGMLDPTMREMITVPVMNVAKKELIRSLDECTHAIAENKPNFRQNVERVLSKASR